MKKYFLSLLTIIALSAVALSSFSGTMADEDAPEYDYPLYAGQNQLVGYVDVDNDGDNLYVNYIITEDGWCLSETHLDIQTDVADFPYASSGRGRSAIQNVVPGLFAYSEPHECVETKEYVIQNDWDAETDLLVAAHANVEQWNIYEECVDVQVELQAQSLEVVSDTTDLFFDEVNNEWKNAVAAWVHPAWDSNVNIPGATWIWTDYKVSQDEAQFGAEPEFKKEFNLPLNAENITGSIMITVDNEYELFINGEYVGSNNSWQTVNTYDVSGLLEPGDNTITIEAVNWAWNTTNPEANPGGIIYKLAIEYDEPIYEEQCEEFAVKLGEETAWGADGEAGSNRFTPRGNWATYFVYTTTDEVEPEPDPEYCDVYRLDVASVNGNPAYWHWFEIDYPELTGTGDGAAGPETVSDVVFDTGIMKVSFKSVYTNNYTWYPSFTLNDDNSLTFHDGHGADNVHSASGTWSCLYDEE